MELSLVTQGRSVIKSTCCDDIHVLGVISWKTKGTVYLLFTQENRKFRLENPHHFIWEASENMGCDLRWCDKFIFLPFPVCAADLDLLCSGSFTHHFKFNRFIFLHKISTQVVCVNGSPQESNSVVQNQWVPVQKPILILLVILYYSWLLHEKFLQFDWFRAFSLIWNT